MNSGPPEVVDNSGRYGHAAALQYLAERYPRSLRVATGYVNLGGLRELAALPGPVDRSARLLLGAMPPPGLGDDGATVEALEAGKLFDETLRRLREQRDFDAFPPSRRRDALEAVDRFLADERVDVRRYTNRFLHGKAYLFAEPPGLDEGNPGAALVTSANLTAAGLHANLELGLVQYQPSVVDEAVSWFDGLWSEAEDFKEGLRDLLFPHIPEYTPQQVFLRMLLEQYGEELPEKPPATVNRLARFQEDGYRRAQRIVDRYGGVLYADGVGTGKTHIGLEFIEEYVKRRGLHVLVIAPAQLRDRTWHAAIEEANLPGRVVSFQELAMDEQLARSNVLQKRRVLALDKDVYRLVIVDEAHAFRTADTTYYHALKRLLGGVPKDLLLLTATPVNNALWDLYNEIMLFAQHDAAFADGPPGVLDLRKFFRDAGANDPESVSAEAMFPLIDAVTVRRDRRFLKKHYGDDTFPDGTPVRFPEPRLTERRYDLDGVYPGAFQRITDGIGRLTMARYQPDRYRLDPTDGRAASEEALAGLIQSGLLKRFESSVEAARLTVHRMHAMYEAVIAVCEQGEAVPSPAAARTLYVEVREGEVLAEAVEEILEADEEAIPLEDLNDAFIVDMRIDREILAGMLVDLETLSSEEDPKLAELVDLLNSTPSKKVAIFTTFGDTARYLREALEASDTARGDRAMVTVIGDELGSDERQHLMERFCPKSVTGDDLATAPGGEVDLMLATDVISEGQNLQQAQAVVSYDMPWNPQRIVQRNGRVIRLKSDFDEVFLYTLLPEQGELDRLLHLEARLTTKIRAANASVGMESQVLAAVADEERAFADLKRFSDRLADGDEDLLDEGEGTVSGSSAGEEYRAMLSRAQQEGDLPSLRAMPWGVGAVFAAHSATPAVSLPAVVFAARDRRGGLHWRAVTSDGGTLDQDLNLLRLADPATAGGTTLPDDFDLEASWQQAAEHICRDHNALLDPAARAVRLPASQRWALERLRDPSLPDRDSFVRADQSLAVPRGQAVLRELSQIRRDVREAHRTPMDAAEEIARIVLDVFGLQPAEPPTSDRYSITPDDLGVVAYQVVVP